MAGGGSGGLSRASLSKDMEGLTNLVTALRQRASALPTQLVYTFLTASQGHYDMTFADLEFGAQRIAAVLQSQKKARFTVGDRVLLWFSSNDNYDLVMAFWGCLYAGAVAVIVDPDAPDLARVVEDTKPCLGLTTSHFRHQRTLHKVKNAFSFKKDVKLSGNQDDANDEVIFKQLKWYDCDAKAGKLPFDSAHIKHLQSHGEDALACLLYTSGTSGRPKPVSITHGNALAAARPFGWISSTNDSIVGWLSLHQASAWLYSIVLPVLRGCRGVHFNTFWADPSRWMQLVAKHRAVLTYGPPQALAMAASATSDQLAASLDLSCLRSLTCSGSFIPAAAIDAFIYTFTPSGFAPSRLHCTYGLTETLSVATSRFSWVALGFPTTLRVSRLALEQFNQVEPLEDDQDNEIDVDNGNTTDAMRLVSCGMPLVGTNLAIVDPTTKEIVPEGIVGEIYVSGPHLSRETWQKEKSTVAGARGTSSFCHLEGSNEVFLATGDLGALIDCELYVVGRQTDMILVGDRSISSHLLEDSVLHATTLVPSGGVCVFTEKTTTENKVNATAVVVVALEMAQDFRGFKFGPAMAHSLCVDVIKQIWKDHQVHIGRVLLLKPGTLRRNRAAAMGKTQRWRITDKSKLNSAAVLLEYNRRHEVDEVIALRNSMLDGFLV
ncbi:unnamed protein product [Aphanomyces euteiches]